MSSSRLERWFLKLAAKGYTITSPDTFMYNCFSWAAGDSEHWWEPGSGMRHYYWPPSVPREYALAAYIQAFVSIGYEVCDGSDLEQGFEKVALFSDADGEPSHSARQLVSGSWTSKLGEWEDIEHTTLTALEGDVYGTVAPVLKRPRNKTD
ncbi:MAG: DUF7689 domain-containing protein [Chloroflexia bacterium]